MFQPPGYRGWDLGGGDGDGDGDGGVRISEPDRGENHIVLSIRRGNTYGLHAVLDALIKDSRAPPE